MSRRTEEAAGELVLALLPPDFLCALRESAWSIARRVAPMTPERLEQLAVLALHEGALETDRRRRLTATALGVVLLQMADGLRPLH